MTLPPLFSEIATGAEGERLAHSIRMLCLDVDGVLTDGGIYLGDVGGRRLEMKRFDIQDGVGIRLLQQAGVRVAIITGRVSESVTLRAAELGIDDLVQDARARKLPALIRMAEHHDIPLESIAFIGDDLPDIGALQVVGLPVAVANATPDAFRVARYRLSRRGGDGAVREFAETLLTVRGQWEPLVQNYVSSREQTLPTI